MANNKGIKVGDVFTTNYCDSCVVILYNNAVSIDIEFTSTGYKTKVSATSLRNGTIKDPYKPFISGVGYIGTGSFLPREGGKPTREYGVWYQMLERCYSSSHKSYSRYGGRGVVVCENWHNFQNFAKWYRSQDNHRDITSQLDKDIVSPEVLKYSHETCNLVHREINNLLTNRNKVRGEYPVGVYFHKTRNKYKAQVNTGHGKKVHLGFFDSVSEAFNVYKLHKEAFIKKKAKEVYEEGGISSLVYKALLDWKITPYPE